MTPSGCAGTGWAERQQLCELAAAASAAAGASGLPLLALQLLGVAAAAAANDSTRKLSNEGSGGGAVVHSQWALAALDAARQRLAASAVLQVGNSHSLVL